MKQGKNSKTSMMRRKSFNRNRQKLQRAAMETLETRRYFSSINESLSSVPEHMYEGSYVEAHQFWDLSGNDYGSISIDGGESFSWWVGDPYDFSLTGYYDDDYTTSISLIDNWDDVTTGSLTIENVQPVAALSYDAGDAGGDYTLSLSDPFDPSTDDQGKIRYSFAHAYADLGNFGDANTTSSHTFDLQDSDGVVWARIFDDDGGYSDYNSSYSLPTLNWGQVNTTSVSFSWNDIATSEQGWYVQRALYGGSFSTIDDIPANSHNYIDTTVQPNTRYQYRVRAYGAPGTAADTAYSAKRAITTTAPPTANFTATLTNAGASVLVELSNPTNPRNATPLRYSFGTSVGDLKSWAASTTTTSANITVPSGATTLTLYGRIIDPDGYFSEYSQTIPVGDLRPTADLSTTSALEGGTAHIMFTGSSDPQGLGTKFAFAKLGDPLPTLYSSVTSTLTYADLTFNDDGTYAVIGRVIDSADLYRDYTVSVSVAQVAPTISAHGETLVKEGTYTLTIAGATGETGDDTITEYKVNWGDGTSSTVTPSPTMKPTHVFKRSAIENVIVTATDEDGTYAADPVALDSSFGSAGEKVIGLSGFARAIAVQPDGKILVAGSTGTGGDQPNFGVARLNVDGSIDLSFGTNGIVVTNLSLIDVASAIAVQKDGKIVVAGTANGDKFGIVRYLPNGKIDSNFGTSGKIITAFGYMGAQSVAISDDGKIVVAGPSGVWGSAGLLVARFLSNGTPDTSFSSDGIASAYFEGGGVTPVLLQGSKIVVGGSEAGHFFLSRFLSNGQVDSSFGIGGRVTTNFPAGQAQLRALALDAEGRIVAVGDANSKIALARYTSNGTPDDSFGTSGKRLEEFVNSTYYSTVVADVVILPNQRISVVGKSTTPSGMKTLIAAFAHADGTPDVSFGGKGTVLPGVYANAAALSADGQLLTAGGGAGGNMAVWKHRIGVANSVAVTDVQPILSFGGKKSAEVGASYSVTLTVNSQSDIDTTDRWQINWGDGTSTAATGSPASGSVQSHPYSTPGRFNVTLSATDEDGTYSKSNEVIIVPAAVPVFLEGSAVADTRVNINWIWTSGAAAPTTLELQKSTTGGAFSTETTVTTADLKHQVSGLVADTTYRFRLKAMNGTTLIGYSDEISVHTLPAGVVYSNDFGSGTTGEFSNAPITTSPKKNVKFLGELGSAGTTLSLSGLPTTSNKFLVSFDLYLLRSWDGNDPSFGQDVWKFDVLTSTGNVSNSVINATFSNFHLPSIHGHTNDYQSYPDQVGQGSHKAQTGSLRPTDTTDPDTDLGYHFTVAGRGDTPMSSVYRIERQVTAAELGSLKLKFSADLNHPIEDESWGIDNLKVVQIPENTPPSLSFTSGASHQIPAEVHASLGNVQFTPTSGSVSKRINLIDHGSGANISGSVQVTALPSGGTRLPVDVFLLVDDTGSMGTTGDMIAAQLPAALRSIRERYPKIDLGVGVGRVTEYDHLEKPESGDAAPRIGTQERPFILNQPIVRLDDTDFADLQKAYSNPSPAEAAILLALKRKHSPTINRQTGTELGGSSVSMMEALFQIATGAGFDGNEDGSTTSHGAAGSYWAQIGNPAIPGHPSTEEDPSLGLHDVPAFSSYSPDPQFKMLPPAGSIGGVGFRVGAIPIVVAATDSPLVYQSAPASTQPGAPALVYGKVDANDLSVPLSSFTKGIVMAAGSDGGGETGSGQAHWYYDVQAGGKHVALGNTRTSESKSLGGATIQNTVHALNAANIKVVGLGVDTATRYAHRWTEDPTHPAVDANHPGKAVEHASPGAPMPFDEAPRSYLEAIATLTGAINRTDGVIDSNQGPTDLIDPGDPLFFKVDVNDTGSPVVPSGTSVTNGIMAAIGGVLAANSNDIEMVVSNRSQTAMTITNGSGPAFDVAAGQPQDFQISAHIDTAPAANDLLFVDKEKGQLIGSIPVIAESAAYEFQITVSDADSDAVTLSISKASLSGLAEFVPDAHIELRGTTNYFVFNPTLAGQYEFTISATDFKGAVTSKTFQVHVTAKASTNNAPFIDEIAPRTLTFDSALSIPVVGADPEGEALSYYLFNPPQGMTIKPAGTGATISWVPTREYIGTVTATVVAIDGDGGMTLREFSVTVTPPTNLAAPIISSETEFDAVATRFLNLQFKAVDVDGGSVVIQRAGTHTGSPVQLPNETNMHLDPSGGFSWMPSVRSTYVLHLEAVDSQGAVTPFNVTINVRQAPTAPPTLLSFRRDFADGAKILLWMPASDTDIVGYNIYVAPMTEGANVPDTIRDPYQLLNKTPISVPTSGLAGGATLNLSNMLRWSNTGGDKEYSLYMVSVNADGVESARSNLMLAANGTPIVRSIGVTKMSNGAFRVTPELPTVIEHEPGQDYLERTFEWTPTSSPAGPAPVTTRRYDSDRHSTFTLSSAGVYRYQLRVRYTEWRYRNDQYEFSGNAYSQSVIVEIDTTVSYPSVVAAPSNPIVARTNDTISIVVGKFILLDEDTDTSELIGTFNWGDGNGDVTLSAPSKDVDEMGRTVVNFQAMSPFTSNSQRGSRTGTFRISKGGVVLVEADVPVQVVSTRLAGTPTNLTAIPVANGVVRLSWDKQKGGRYKIYRVNMSSSEHEATLLPAPFNGESQVRASNQYYDSGLLPDTEYRYVVYRADLYTLGTDPVEYLDLSLASNEATATTWGNGNLAEAKELSGLHTRSWDKDQRKYVTGVQLFFKPPFDLLEGIGGYYVDRSIDGTDSNWPDNPTVFDVVDPNGPFYDGKLAFFDDTATFRSGGAVVDSYLYRIRTVSVDGTSISAGVTIRVIADKTAPSRPANVKGISYANGIQLTWDDRPTGDDEDWAGWNVYRKVGSGSLQKLNTQPINDTIGFNDYSAPTAHGAMITYEVRSIDLLGNESLGVTIEKRRALHGEPPNPAAVVALPFNTNTVVLSWGRVTKTGNGPNDDIAKYEVYRSTDFDSDGTLLATLPGSGSGIVSYADTTASDSGADYYYSVQAVDGDDDRSPFTRTRTRLGDAVRPPKPGDISFSNVTDTGVVISWTPSAAAESGYDHAVGYLLFRSTAGGALEPVGNQLQRTQSGSTVESITDDSLLPGTLYTYTLYAIDAEGDLSDAVPSTTTVLDAVTANVTTQQAMDQQPNLFISAPVTTGTGRLVLTADTPVRGIVDDPNNDLKKWFLVLRPESATRKDPPTAGEAPTLNDVVGANDIVVAQGDSEQLPAGSATDALLGSIKPAMIPNGLYKLVLLAFDHKRPPAPAPTESVPNPVEPSDLTEFEFPQVIQIDTEIKAGNFTLPIVDLDFTLPDGRQITVTRTYDSSRANELGDFGYGWFLNLSDTGLTTTSDNSEASGDHVSSKAMHSGDLVYLTVPGEGQHVFQFVPRPTSYTNSWQTIPDPMSRWYNGSYYTPIFVAVDGSDAVLTVVPSGTDAPLLHRIGDEFYIDFNEGEIRPFHPARTENYGVSGKYYLRTGAGTTFAVDAVTGKTIESTDAHNRTTVYELPAPQDQGNITGDGEFAIQVLREGTNSRSGKVTGIKIIRPAWATVLKSVQYEYGDALATENAGTDDLRHFISVDAKSTYYSYDEKLPHFLTGVSDPRDSSKKALSAVYNPSSGRLEAVRDASGTTVPIQNGGFDGTGTQTSVKSPAGSDTNSVYDEHGNVVRSIQTIYDANGVVASYLVTVKQFNYFNPQPDINDLMNYGVSKANTLASVVEYRPFSVAWNEDPYSAEADASLKMREVLYHDFTAPQELDFVMNYVDPNFRHIWKDTVYDADGTARTTEYLNYKLGKPQVIKDADDHYTYFNYDNSGNLLWTVNSLGEGTRYTYPTGSGNYTYADGAVVAKADMPKGVVLESYRIRASLNANPELFPSITWTSSTPDSANYYYVNTSSAPVGSRGKLKATTNAAGVRTVYAYDTEGRTAITATLWDNPSGTDRWVVSRSVFDDADRVIQSWQGVYTDTGTAGDLAWTVASTTETVNGFLLHSGDVKITETRYSDERKLGATSYNALGKVATTTDQYGGVTTNYYDIRGQLVRTLYADGTGTRSVYDVMGRAILVTDRFKSGQSDPINATRTVYDALGRVSETQRVSDVTVTITQDGSTEIYNVTDVSGAGLVAGSGTGIWELSSGFSGYLSRNQTYYDDAGGVVETVNADGLRTGTIYYDNGQVHYSGRIVALADGQTTVPLFRSLEGSTDEYLADATIYEYRLTTGTLPTDAVSYDKVTDARGYATKTYVDMLGRNIRTTFHDGTYTETLYGISGLPVGGHEVGSQTNTGTTPHSLLTAARQETKIDQLGNATDYFYDQAGRLTDVYLPEVTDALNGNPSRPHWHYAYDANGNQSSQVDPKGHTTSFTYDEFGRRLTRTLPLSQSESSHYDSFGRVDQSIDFKGNTTVFVYFASGANVGRLQYKRYYTPGQALNTTPNQEVEYSYDSLGRTDTVTERSAGTTVQITAYGYDPITGSVTLETLYDSASSSYAKILRRAYDPASGRLIATWTASSTGSATDLTGARTAAITLTEYGYDTFGRLSTATLKRVNSTTVTKTTTNTYDAVGNLDTVTQPNGVVTDYDYDTLNRLNHEVITKSNGNKLLEQTYALLNNGQRDYVIEKRYNGGGNAASNVFSNVKVDWSYDALDRLTGETWDADSTPSNGSDDFGTQDGSDYIDTYSFDLAGNRILKTHDAANNSNDVTVRSGYNDNDQLLWVSNNGDDDSNGSYETGDSQYTYDANGSTTVVTTTTSSGSTTAKNVWDVRNRLIGYDANGNDSLSDSGDAKYTYTDSGHRISKTIGSTATYFVIDDLNPTGYSQVLEERGTITGSPQQTYILALDVSGQVSGASSYSYFGYDGHGSTRLLTDSNGAQISPSSFDYDAFGNSLFGGTTLTNLLYSGEYWDTEKASYYLRARSYDPTIGRFTSFDSFEADPQSPTNLHKYIYARSNPVRYVDPTGNVTAAEGKLIHREIESIYVLNHPGNAVVVESAVSTGRGMLFPDIMDSTLGEVAEIKPLTPYGLASGSLQLNAYLLLLNGISFTWRGKTYTPVPATPNATRGPWKASTWAPGVMWIPIPSPDKFIFTVGNLGGVIYYIEIPNPAFYLSEARKIAENVADELGTLCSVAGAGVEMVETALRQIQFQTQFKINTKQLTNLGMHAVGATLTGISLLVASTFLRSSLAPI